MKEEAESLKCHFQHQVMHEVLSLEDVDTNRKNGLFPMNPHKSSGGMVSKDKGLQYIMYLIFKHIAMISR